MRIALPGNDKNKRQRFNQAPTDFDWKLDGKEWNDKNREIEMVCQHCYEDLRSQRSSPD
jgi:hypothetical protein